MVTIRFRVENQTGIVDLCRPQVRNAINSQMIAELTELFSKIPEDIKVMIIRGEGESFCAGADLEWMKGSVALTQSENKADANRLFEMLHVMHECPVPLFALIHGHAMGGAIGMVSVCDVVLSESSTQFAFSEVKLGLAPAVISPFVLSKVSYSKAMEWMITGRRFYTEEALHAGLVHHKGSWLELESLLSELVDQCLKNSSEAVRETKKLVRFVSERSTLDSREYVTELIATLRVGDEAQRRMKQFFQAKKG